MCIQIYPSLYIYVDMYTETYGVDCDSHDMQCAGPGRGRETEMCVRQAACPHHWIPWPVYMQSSYLFTYCIFR